MTSFLLILYLGTTPQGTPTFIIKPFDTEQSCRYNGALLEVEERLKGNWDTHFNCIQQMK